MQYIRTTIVKGGMFNVLYIVGKGKIQILEFSN